MAGSDQKRLRDKGRKVEEYPADVVATLRRNAKEGPRSSVSGEPRYFGGPPSGRPPSGRPPRVSQWRESPIPEWRSH